MLALCTNYILTDNSFARAARLSRRRMDAKHHREKYRLGDAGRLGMSNAVLSLEVEASRGIG